MLNTAQEDWVEKIWIREMELNSSSKYIRTGTMHSMLTEKHYDHKSQTQSGTPVCKQKTQAEDVAPSTYSYQTSL